MSHILFQITYHYVIYFYLPITIINSLISTDWDSSWNQVNKPAMSSITLLGVNCIFFLKYWSIVMYKIIFCLNYRFLLICRGTNIALRYRTWVVDIGLSLFRTKMDQSAHFQIFKPKIWPSPTVLVPYARWFRDVMSKPFRATSTGAKKGCSVLIGE